MIVRIRQENQEDHPDVFNLIKAAFQNEAYSDHKEQFLVDRLRQSDAFIPELSLIAELDEKIVGHILLSKIKINGSSNSYPSLALAPVSVLPKMQNKGIGGQLIRHAHSVARKLGYGSVILLGHEDYYPRFGYKQAHLFGISLPFDVPKDNCMAIELIEDALLDVEGIVEYPKAFFE